MNESYKEKIKNINNDNSLLSNLEMIKNLKALLINGNISLLDYENFIEVEGLSFIKEII